MGLGGSAEVVWTVPSALAIAASTSDGADATFWAGVVVPIAGASGLRGAVGGVGTGAPTADVSPFR